jgi:opacity protein-like surface antigen
MDVKSSTMVVKRAILTAVLGGAGVAFAARTSFAQSDESGRTIRIGIAAGITWPESDLSTTTNAGYNGTLSLFVTPQGLPLPLPLPLGLRLDGGYNRFDFQTGGGGVRVLSATANVFFSTSITSMLSPYIVGGGGLYNVGYRYQSLPNSSTSHFGFNIGGGIKLPLEGFDALLEARYNRVNVNGGTISFVPVTFGISF